MERADYDREVERAKVPPHSMEAEQSVLGGMMLDNNAWDVVSEIVVDSHFYSGNHRNIFRTMQKLIDLGRPIDVVTLSEELDRTGELEACGGLEYLVDLASNTPSASNIRAYSEIVRDRALLRQMISVSNEINASAFFPEGRGADEILNEAESKIFQIAEDRPNQGGPQGVNPLLKEAVERIDELFGNSDSLTGVTTGFDDLDEATGGLQKSDLIIVAARPSMGKTTFAMNLVENALMASNKPVLVFSLEMPAAQLVTRMLSSLGRINQTKVRNGQLEDDDWPKLTAAVNMLKNKPLFIDDQAGISPNEMRTRARRIVREHGPLSRGMAIGTAALIKDLKQRGMLDETLIVWGGEFGRQPTAEYAKGTGRDHNAYGFTMWLAGGGIKGGVNHGKTDDLCVNAVEDKVHIHDLNATILHQLGFDHEKLTTRFQGRDFRLTDVHGHVIKPILS